MIEEQEVGYRRTWEMIISRRHMRPKTGIILSSHLE
jgi:hypothetical protein